MGTVFAGATGISLFEGKKRQKKIERAQENQAKVDRAIQAEEAARSRRATIKEAMIKRAQIENIAGASGQSKSSAAVSATQQITGDVSENIGSINTNLSLSNLSTRAQLDLNKAQVPSDLEQIANVVQQGAISFKQ